jgi:hypothetical protein
MCKEQLRMQILRNILRGGALKLAEHLVSAELSQTRANRHASVELVQTRANRCFCVTGADASEPLLLCNWCRRERTAASVEPVQTRANRCFCVTVTDASEPPSYCGTVETRVNRHASVELLQTLRRYSFSDYLSKPSSCANSPTAASFSSAE